ncbi:MAG: hypothetical protein DI626_11375 [Micavibrio aeruginosavorus]|uniref:Uncharacterized protein n=1 Tax=Micavibrio aeruginosavorus TaxID=349221 RepID=A0A2W4ZCS4_9BACT|nr:MAG: hypothetical protein DI626_11375 [Micavibrio aeruginosavorus]
MSAAIQTSLTKLNAAVKKLETALDTKKADVSRQRKASPAETDLFSAMTAGQNNPSNMNPVNVRMLATRLDNAIDQVEKILKEGRG